MTRPVWMLRLTNMFQNQRVVFYAGKLALTRPVWIDPNSCLMEQYLSTWWIWCVKNEVIALRKFTPLKTRNLRNCAYHKVYIVYDVELMCKTVYRFYVSFTKNIVDPVHKFMHLYFFMNISTALTFDKHYRCSR